MTPEQIISNFLRTAYTDEKLAALYAHVEDGKFSFVSCCCLRGAATADHALRGRMPIVSATNEYHYSRSSEIPGAVPAERALHELLDDELSDGRAREIMLPLIRAEMSRRESSSSQTAVSEVVVTV